MGAHAEKQGFGPDDAGSSGRLAGLGMAILAHAAVGYGIVQYQPTSAALTPAVVPAIMVDFVMAPPVARPVPPEPTPRIERPRPMKAKPTPPRPAPVPAPQVMSTLTERPAERAFPAEPPEPAPPSKVAPAAPAIPAPAVAAPDLPPSYNADYLQNPAPRYPPLARRMGQQGKVVLRVLVNTRGAAAQVEVRSSSGSDLLDAAAREAVHRWRFVPARQGAEPVAAWVLIPITFSLQG